MVPTRRLPLCRCAFLAFRSFSPSLLFLFSFLSPSLSSSRSCNFSLYDVARYVRTDATRRAKNGLAATWWPLADAVIVSFAPMSMSMPVFHERSTPPSRDAIERNGRDVRNVGYFPVRESFVHFLSRSPFPLFLRRKKSAGFRCSFLSLKSHCFYCETMLNFFCSIFAVSLSPDFENTAKEKSWRKEPRKSKSCSSAITF